MDRLSLPAQWAPEKVETRQMISSVPRSSDGLNVPGNEPGRALGNIRTSDVHTSHYQFARWAITFTRRRQLWIRYGLALRPRSPSSSQIRYVSIACAHFGKLIMCATFDQQWHKFSYRTLREPDMRIVDNRDNSFLRNFGEFVN